MFKQFTGKTVSQKKTAKNKRNSHDYSGNNQNLNYLEYANLDNKFFQINQGSLPTVSDSSRESKPKPRINSSSLTKTRPQPRNLKPKKNKNKKNKLKISALFKYVIRLLILGVGFGAIAGTILYFIEENNQILSQGQKVEKSTIDLQKNPLENHLNRQLILGKQLILLKEKVQKLTQKMPQMQTGVFFVDVDNGDYLDIESNTVFSAASTIKIPILVAFFQDVDAKKIRLDEKLTLEKDVIGGGSGNMQYQKRGTKYTALETAIKMISISDNTATNMLIKRLGGKELLNQRFREWGLTNTAINNYLPDLKGTNTSSPRDLGNLLAMVQQGELISLKSRDRLLVIMRQTRTRTLLPQGLGKGAIIAHKTGDIGTILADAGIVDMPNGKRYIAVAMVKRPHNDYAARTLIQNISRTAYQYFNRNNFILTPKSE